MIRRRSRAGFLSGARRHAAIAAAGLLLLAVAYVATQRSARVLYEAESPFGRIRVIERTDGLRQLRTGESGAVQTSLYPGRPLHLHSPYVRVAMIGLALAPSAPRILYVGLGGGAMPTYTRHVRPDATIDVVEIDPAIVDVAQRYFGFSPDERLRVHTGDGRAFLERALPGAYDVIVLDAFSAHEVPYALTTREFLQTVRARLAPDGVVVSNLWSGDAYADMVATYAAVFPQVRLLDVPRRRQRILLAASGRSLEREELVDAATALQQRAELGFDLAALVRSGYEGAPRVRGSVLRD